MDGPEQEFKISIMVITLVEDYYFPIKSTLESVLNKVTLHDPHTTLFVLDVIKNTLNHILIERFQWSSLNFHHLYDE